jgi:hypothetical protein
MGLFSLIFNKPVKPSFEVVRDQGGGQGKIIFEMDCSLSETHKRKATVSQNAIEDGSNVADNVNLGPRGLELKALISDAPISLIGSAVGLGISSATQAVSAAVGTSVLGNAVTTAAGLGLGSIAGLITGSPKDPKKAWKFLDEIWERREPFTVVTALQRYENMVIADLSAPRSATVGKGLEFDITLEQVRIVQSSVIKVPVYKTSALGAQSKAKLGKQAGKESDNSSIAFKLLGFKKAG